MTGEIPEQTRINRHESGGTTYFGWEQPYSYEDASGREAINLQIASQVGGKVRIRLIRASLFQGQSKSPATKIVFHEDGTTKVYTSDHAQRPGELSTVRRDWKKSTPDIDQTNIERMTEEFTEEEAALLEAGLEKETYDQVRTKLGELIG